MNYSDFLTQAVIISILAAGVRLATPILLASLGELLSERSGVLNLGLEGVMMFGTLFGFVVSQQTGSPWLGALAGAAAGGIAGLIIGFLCITIYGNQAIVGVVFNILAVGLTGFIFRAIYGVRTTETPPWAQGFAPLEIPILKDIPILGDIFFKHPPLVYIAINGACNGILAVANAVRFECSLGRWFCQSRRHDGDQRVQDPLSRFNSGGALAGLGGAFLSVQLGVYRDGMTQGRGWIAIAIVTFARWNPWAALAGSLLFGVADSLQLYLQAFGFKIPYQFLLMLPYVMTVIVLVISSSRAISPSVLGVPYIRDRKT